MSFAKFNNQDSPTESAALAYGPAVVVGTIESSLG